MEKKYGADKKLINADGRTALELALDLPAPSLRIINLLSH
jgi:hypothetical protein